MLLEQRSKRANYEQKQKVGSGVRRQIKQWKLYYLFLGSGCIKCWKGLKRMKNWFLYLCSPNGHSFMSKSFELWICICRMNNSIEIQYSHKENIELQFLCQAGKSKRNLLFCRWQQFWKLFLNVLWSFSMASCKHGWRKWKFDTETQLKAIVRH